MALVAGGTAGSASAQTGAESSCGTDYGQADWNAPVPGTVINQLTLRILVGNDDIRQGTGVFVSVHIKNGSGDTWVGPGGPVNNDAAYPNGSLLQAKISLANTGLGQLTIENVLAIYVSYSSGLPDLLSTWDNWNMSAVRVLYPKSPTLNPPLTTSINWSQYNQLLYGSGSPWLHRFKFSCDSEGGPFWEAARTAGGL
jgi:hypothetical protein